MTRCFSKSYSYRTETCLNADVTSTSSKQSKSAGWIACNQGMNSMLIGREPCALPGAVLQYSYIGVYYYVDFTHPHSEPDIQT